MTIDGVATSTDRSANAGSKTSTPYQPARVTTALTLVAQVVPFWNRSLAWASAADRPCTAVAGRAGSLASTQACRYKVPRLPDGQVRFTPPTVTLRIRSAGTYTSRT